MMYCEKTKAGTKPRSNKFSGRPIVLGLARFMLASGPFVTDLLANTLLRALHNTDMHAQ